MALHKFCQRTVVTITPDMYLIEACQLLLHHNVGCLVVEEEGKLCGIPTDRDIALKAIGQGKEPQQTMVREIMTHNPACIEVDKTFHDLTALMHEHHVRRVPIVDAEGKVLGLVSMDDLWMLLSVELSDLGQGISGALVRPQVEYEADWPFEEWLC